MKRESLRRWSAASLSLLGMALWFVFAGSAQTPKERPAQSGSDTTAPQLLSVNVVHVKPELLLEWQEFQKKETIPMLQKAGIREREAWQTIFGDAYEYAFVTPMANLAVRDETSPMVKALGEEGARAYGMKNRRFIVGSRSFVIRTRPDLSYAPSRSEPPKLAVISALSVAPGRTTDYANYVKNEILPIQKKAQAKGYLVSQTMFGGDGNQFVTLSLVDTFADLDKGPAAIRVLGEEGAAKLSAKTAGIVAHVERKIIRYDADLSFRTATSTAAK
jgi:hypothetical protein